MTSTTDLQTYNKLLKGENHALQQEVKALKASTKQGNRRGNGHQGGTPHVEGGTPRTSNQQRTILALKAIEGCIIALQAEVVFKNSAAEIKFTEHIAAIKEIHAERAKHELDTLAQKGDRISNAKKATKLDISDDVLQKMLSPEDLKTYHANVTHNLTVHEETEAKRLAALPKGPRAAGDGIDTTELMREL
jgi:hypothetical protein